VSYLRYLCWLSYIGAQNILCFVFFFFFSLRLVYLMLPVSLDCPFLIAPSVFSNVYLNYTMNETKQENMPRQTSTYNTRHRQYKA